MWSAETVVACALALLTRSEASFPPIEFVEHPPAFVSPNAEGFVRVGEPRIYLVTSSPVFRRARQAMYRCGDVEAHRKLASVLVHEEWHVKHGADEVQAYMTQLLTLIRLGGGPGHPEYTAVWRSMRAARARRQANSLVAGLQ